MPLIKLKYRITTDKYCGFKVEKKVKFWFFPWSFWFEAVLDNAANTFSSIAEAHKAILDDKFGKQPFSSRVVYEENDQATTT